MSRPNNQSKTGSYAVTTVYSVPWTKKTTQTPAPKRKRAEKKVVNEIFERCSEITTDPYWISVFKECARGKFPRGFSFKYGLLTHRKGNKKSSEIIPNTAEEAVIASLKFFKDSAGIMSIADRKKVQMEHEEQLIETLINRELCWKDIKTERTKEVLLSEYVTELSKKSNYNTEQRKELVTIVNSAFLLKYFSSKHIEMSQGRIINITGLLYDAETNTYDIDPKLTNKVPRRTVKGLGLQPKIEKRPVSFMNNWSKFIASMDKTGTRKRTTRRPTNRTPKSNFAAGSSSTSLSGELYSPSSF